MQRSKWSIESKCSKEEIPLWFFFDEGSLSEVAEFCSDCPVRTQCREYSILHEEWGKWAGTSQKYRRLQRKMPKFKTLVYRSLSEGWLEDHNVVPKKILADAQEILEQTQKVKAARLLPQPIHQKTSSILNLEFDFDLPALAFM